VPTRVSFEYAVIRVVPQPERGEFINAGVIVFSLSKKFLEARIRLDPGRLRALFPEADTDAIQEHLEAFPKVCAGAENSGLIARLSLRERFHWLVAPRSTMIQISPVHTGLCESPEAALSALFQQLVERPKAFVRPQTR
jgi:hypothetical protein